REISRTFVIDLHTLTPAILAKTVAQLEEDYEREEEERMVEEVYSMAAAGDLAALGVDRVADAVNLHAVAQLLIHDGVATPGARCGSCGALSRPRPRCVLCGGKTTQVSDLLEAMASAVGESGGRVEHVTAGTRLESDLAAASLRYSIW
ncbi:MAG TPA: hypothetical protein VE569_05570, partial [Acidimicrobiia bacterium]|nr:hypothetical protein [Acidimicrobiia bacterium]